ncbi:MAG TPA: Ni/Fe-hydrogenase cytochrome b subunit [Candidatus Sulfotelmatobacter sp.]|nr:Ni/Fe-hydrogenase cytochrome b subunit [Candidatus Sulfotelmatobacter sp.]
MNRWKRKIVELIAVANVHHATKSTHDEDGATLVNHWQRGVPVYREPLITPGLLFFAALAAIGLTVALVRFFSPLGPFVGMNDAYAWGIWKTFNVMTLTALGSGPLAVGMAAWVFNREKLHTVMRTALVSGFLFYATGLVALGFDVGRAWNFYSIVMPWRWNAHSAMLEICFCMPVYCAFFLAFENLPLVLERFYYTGTDETKAFLKLCARPLRRIYPFMLTGAYVLPLMHQSSLGGLMLLAGDKVHPLWQTPFLPLLYLLAAGFCGLGFVIFLLLMSCLRYSRPLDAGILGELGNLLSYVCFIFLAVQFGDLVWRRQLGAAFAFDGMSLLFLFETVLILVPAVALRGRATRETPRSLLTVAVLACLGGLLYRFIPTTIAFFPARHASYFPSTAEWLMTVGYISLGIVGFSLAVKFFAVLPGEIKDWKYMFRLTRQRRPAATSEGENSWPASLSTP